MKTKIKTTKHDLGTASHYWPQHSVAGCWFDFQIKRKSPRGPYFETISFDSKIEAKKFISQFKTFDDVKAWEAKTWETP